MKLFKKPLSALFGSREDSGHSHAKPMEFLKPLAAQPAPKSGGGCGSGSCGCGAGPAEPEVTLNQVWSDKPNVLRLQAGRQFVHPGEDRVGSDGTRVAIGRTLHGRFLRVIYVPDPEPKSVFVITAYDLRGKPALAYRRRRRNIRT